MENIVQINGNTISMIVEDLMQRSIVAEILGFSIDSERLAGIMSVI